MVRTAVKATPDNPGEEGLWEETSDFDMEPPARFTWAYSCSRMTCAPLGHTRDTSGVLANQRNCCGPALPGLLKN